MNIKLLFVILLALVVTGCASVNKKSSVAEDDGYKLLELSTSSDDIEVPQVSLDYDIAEPKLAEESSVTEMIDPAKLSEEQIQSALKKAGFYKGVIDGKIGPNTRKAIRDFQKANGMVVDGVAGRRTKAALVKYL